MLRKIREYFRQRKIHKLDAFFSGLIETCKSAIKDGKDWRDAGVDYIDKQLNCKDEPKKRSILLHKLSLECWETNNYFGDEILEWNHYTANGSFLYLFEKVVEPELLNTRKVKKCKKN